MSPARNPAVAMFDAEVNAFEDIVNSQPVDRETVLGAVEHIEQTGQQMIGVNAQKIPHFVESLHSVFGKLAETQVEPPFTETHNTRIKGTFALYAAMLDRNQPKQRRGKFSSKSTDVSTARTDQLKK